jgi:uncharacterized protein (DUF488 family)
VALLRAHDIGLVADVRAYPRSRRHPHFNQESLAAELPSHGIAYRHYPGLGGRRKPRPDSPNAGWENDAFRAYADHAMTDAFAAALDDLAGHASTTAAAVMCAEGLWWHCHRRLIADRLSAAGWAVHHISPGGALTEHTLPPFAQTRADGTVLYPPPPQLFE